MLMVDLLDREGAIFLGILAISACLGLLVALASWTLAPEHGVAVTLVVRTWVNSWQKAAILGFTVVCGIGGFVFLLTSDSDEEDVGPGRRRPKAEYEGLGRGERTQVRGSCTASKNSSAKEAGPAKPSENRVPQASPRARAAPSAPGPQPGPRRAGGAEPSASAAARPSGAPAAPERRRRTTPEPPVQSPRSAARALVGDRLSAEQAAKAAEKILALRRFVNGDSVATLGQIWGFFDMPVPSGTTFNSKDPAVQTLKSKLNRVRLLLHPDKNGHPDAERTFKFLEQSHQRLLASCVRGDVRSAESVHQRTRREEQELKEEQAKRQREEAAFRESEERRQREEDEKMERQRREEEENARRAELERERLEVMRRDKEARGERAARARAAGGPAPAPAPTPAPQPSPQPARGDLGAQNPVGFLKVRLIGAKDLPEQQFLMATDAYAVVSVGTQSFRSPGVSGCNPVWGCSFRFNVHRVDTALRVSVHRQSLLRANTGWSWFQDEVLDKVEVPWLQDDVLGAVEIPFLDLEEWSGCTIGRLLEPTSGTNLSDLPCMIVELQGSLEWL